VTTVSKTDKTKPYWVRVAEHHPRQNHDHGTGVCDLPPSPYDDEAQSYRRNCRWEAQDLHATCCLGCSCSLCSMWGPVQRRAARHRVTQALNGASWERERWPNARKYKNTARWCRGKEGRHHVAVVRYGKWASWRIGNGRTPCGWEPWGDPRWQCYHEIGCSTCGKILYPFLSQGECPTWQEERVSTTASQSERRRGGRRARRASSRARSASSTRSSRHRRSAT
jgi:hypothetical protein